MTKHKPTGDRYLAMWVGFAFALMFTAWAVLFWIASNNQVESVPLAAPEATEVR